MQEFEAYKKTSEIRREADLKKLGHLIRENTANTNTITKNMELYFNKIERAISHNNKPIQDIIKLKQTASNRIEILEAIVADIKDNNSNKIESLKSEILRDISIAQKSINKHTEISVEVDLVNHKLKGNILREV